MQQHTYYKGENGMIFLGYQGGTGCNLPLNKDIPTDYMYISSVNFILTYQKVGILKQLNCEHLLK